MKKLIIGMFLIGASSIAGAWEFKDNPDRYPSVALNFAGSKLNGTRFETVFDQSGIQLPMRNTDAKDEIREMGGDFRLPLSDAFTLTLMYSRVSVTEKRVRYTSIPTSPIYNDSTEMDGNRFGVSFRMYLGR